MKLKICQSCGMPMKEEQYGTNENGSRSEKYCIYCYQQGKFPSECTLEQMVDFCAPFEVESGRCKDLEEARSALMKYFPTLERWKNCGKS